MLLNCPGFPNIGICWNDYIGLTDEAGANSFPNPSSFSFNCFYSGCSLLIYCSSLFNYISCFGFCSFCCSDFVSIFFSWMIVAAGAGAFCYFSCATALVVFIATGFGYVYIGYYG